MVKIKNKLIVILKSSITGQKTWFNIDLTNGQGNTVSWKDEIIFPMDGYTYFISKKKILVKEFILLVQNCHETEVYLRPF